VEVHQKACPREEGRACHRAWAGVVLQHHREEKEGRAYRAHQELIIVELA
jgi:hypothetical protein